MKLNLSDLITEEVDNKETFTDNVKGSEYRIIDRGDGKDLSTIKLRVEKYPPKKSVVGKTFTLKRVIDKWGMDHPLIRSISASLQGIETSPKRVVRQTTKKDEKTHRQGTQEKIKIEGGNSSFLDAVNYIANELGISPHVAFAIMKVESSGRALDNEGFPIVHFTVHLWNRAIQKGKYPSGEIDSGLKNLPQIKNKNGEISTSYIGGQFSAAQVGKSGYLNAASKNQKLAFECASWGPGQVMGYIIAKNYGGNTQKAFDVLTQKDIKKRELAGYLPIIQWFKNSPSAITAARNLDWQNLARLYNGPRYAENRYDENLEKFYNISVQKNRSA